MMNIFLYRLGQWIALSLPLRFAYALAVIFSDIHHIFADQDRKFLSMNLKAIFPDKSDREIRRIRINVARNFSKYLVDFFRYEKIDKEFIKKQVTIENLRYFDQALAKGRGVIVLTAHIGNWELGGVVLAQVGYPMWVVALEHKYKAVNDFFNRQRESKGMKVIPFSKAARQCMSMLKMNELVALVGDRDFTKEGGLITDFFGKPVSLPKGPAAFALKTGAVIVPGFLIRNPDDTFTLHIENPIDPLEPGYGQDGEKALKELINRYKIIFEECIRRYPDQWYMFKKFWV